MGGNDFCSLYSTPAETGSLEGSVRGQEGSRCLSTAVARRWTAWGDRWSLLKGELDGEPGTFSGSLMSKEAWQIPGCPFKASLDSWLFLSLALRCRAETSAAGL